VRGIDANLVTPLGTAVSTVEIQDITKTVNLYAAVNYVNHQPVLLGHSFSEKPGVMITKTTSELIFQRVADDRVHLTVSKQTTIPSNTLTSLSDPVSGTVIVEGSLRGADGKEY
jgi:hypothetical protein